MGKWQKLAMLLLLAALVVIPFGLVKIAATGDRPSVAAQPMLPSGARWAATAPGKIEPQGGEYRVSAIVPGRIAEVVARAGDQVKQGDLLVRLDDQELAARIAGAAADVALKRFVRDEQGTNTRSKRRYDADDAVFAAEQRQITARLALDRIASARRQRGGKADDVADARAQLQAADAEVVRARAAAADVRNSQGAPDPNPNETALIAARSQWAVLQAMLDQTRIRSPIDGTVIASSAKLGEISAPAAPEPLMIVGDLTQLRVRAEIDGRDIAKVRTGQRATIRLDSTNGVEYSGRVVSIAPGLMPGKLSPRGPRRPGDTDVLEVIVSLDGVPPLLPGLRVDVFFVADQAAPNGEKL